MSITIFVQSHLADGLQLAHGLCQIIEVSQNLLKRRLLVFGDFAVSRDVQSLLQEEEFSRRCVRTDIEPSAQLVRLDKLTLLDYDVAWASSEHEAILERWQSFLPKEGT